jgi:hypothetical protein
MPLPQPGITAAQYGRRRVRLHAGRNKYPPSSSVSHTGAKNLLAI